MNHFVSKFILTIVMVITAMVGYSQQRVRGVVRSADNRPLRGVSVTLLEKPTVGAVTDSLGQYEIVLPERRLFTIRASHVGYVAGLQQMSTDNSSVNFRLVEEVYDMSMVVVTGTRTPKVLKDTPVTTRVISSRDIRQSDATHIGELLEGELPGIEFSYSMNQQIALNMQGFGGNSVLFLVDGERIAGETLDNIDYSRLTLSNVERVEIVKGAASSLYGSSAVGGVVNLITSEFNKPLTLNLNSRYGSNNSWRNGMTLGINRGIYNGVTSFQHTASDEITLKNPGDYNKIYGFRTYSINHKMKIDPCDRLTLTARLGTFFRQRDVSSVNSERYRDFNAGVKSEYRLSENSQLEMAYSFDQYDKSDYLIENHRDVRDYSNVQHIVRSLYNNRLDSDKILTIGGDFMRDYLLSYQFSDDGAYRQYSADLFAQFDWKLTPRMTLLTGVRYDYFSKSEVDNFSPKVAIMYRVGKYTLRGSYSGGFRAPTLKEMYMNFDMANIFTIYGNNKLKSETSHNFLLSAELGYSRFNMTIAGYYNVVDERISTVWSQQLKGMLYTNLDRMKFWGFEANLLSRFACGLSARLSYAYTYESADRGKVLISTMRPHSATLKIEYDKFVSNNYSFGVSLSGRYLSKVTTNEFLYTTINQIVERKCPGYSMWRLAMNNRLFNGINLSISIDNLFDYVPDYYYNNSPTTVGRTFSVGVSIDMERLLGNK